METVVEKAEKKPKTKWKSTTTSLRVRFDTKKKVVAELAKANKKDFGEPVKADDYIALAISLIQPHHIKELQEKSLSYADRIDRDYQVYIQKHEQISKDEYLGKLHSAHAAQSNSEKPPFPEGK